MIQKLQGREKVQWVVVADKVNEIIDLLNYLEEENEKDMQKMQSSNKS